MESTQQVITPALAAAAKVRELRSKISKRLKMKQNSQYLVNKH
jgi:hypothetical protein